MMANNNGPGRMKWSRGQPKDRPFTDIIMHRVDSFKRLWEEGLRSGKETVDPSGSCRRSLASKLINGKAQVRQRKESRCGKKPIDPLHNAHIASATPYFAQAVLYLIVLGRFLGRL